MRTWVLTALWVVGLTVPVSAQINGGTPPITFIPNTTIYAEEVNENFSQLFTKALDRTAGTMTGALFSRDIYPSADGTYDLGSSNFRFRDLYLTGAVNGTAASSFLAAGCPQLTIGYSANQRFTHCVSSTAGVTFDAIGTSPSFTFADPVTVNGALSTSTNLNVGGDIDVTGSATIDGDLTVTGSLNAAVGATVPTGAVMFFDLAACPSGWSELTSARGRYLVGLPAGGTRGSTVGTALSDGENRAVGQHNHVATGGSHKHWEELTASSVDFEPGATRGYTTYFNDSGDLDTEYETPSITIENSGSVAGTNAPYLQLLVCKKD